MRRVQNVVRRMSSSRPRKLLITAAGTENDRVITRVMSDIQAAGGNIEKSRMSSLSRDFTFQLLVRVPEDRWEDVRRTLRDLGREKKLFVITRWSSEIDDQRMALYDGAEGSSRQWDIKLSGADNIGLVYSVVDFLINFGVYIDRFDTVVSKAHNCQSG